MLALILSLILFLFPLAYSPGPGNLFFAVNGAKYGFSACQPANFGYHVATLIVTLLIGLGFQISSTIFPQIMNIMRCLGTAYVLYLAYKIARAGPIENKEKAQRIDFWDGAILLVLNPKAYVIILLMFTQFQQIHAVNQYVFIILISLVFTLNNYLAFSLFIAVGGKIHTVEFG